MATVDHPRRRDRVLVQQVEEQAVLLDLDAGTYFALNDVGARIWDLCDGQRGVEQIVGAILTEFDVDEARARTDVSELLDDLRDEGLISSGAP